MLAPYGSSRRISQIDFKRFSAPILLMLFIFWMFSFSSSKARTSAKKRVYVNLGKKLYVNLRKKKKKKNATPANVAI